MQNRLISKLLCCIGVAGTIALVSCNGGNDNTFVINELMAKNKTCLIAGDGEPHDWIEIRNTSNSEESLQDYTLEKDSDKTYTFPDTVLKPDQCIIVYACKKEIKGELSCGFKMKAKKTTLKLKNPHGTVVSEVKYKKLKDDQSLALTEKGDYDKTFEPTPGFMNDEEGRRQFLEVQKKQRKSDLLIWECRRHSPRWVELKNVGKSDINLAEYGLTDDMDSTRITLPEQALAPGAILVIRDYEKKLSGDVVYLTKKGKYIDGINARDAYPGVTYGRIQDNDGFYYFASPTPGTENTAKAYTSVTKKPKFDKAPGAYNTKSIILRLKKGDATVHYTTDGTIPNNASPVLKDSLVIRQNTIIRYYAETDSSLRSPVETSTYILNVKHTLPVVFITVRDSDLHDYRHGIYMAGPGANRKFPHDGANYWKNWEKACHIEFCDGKEGFSYDCGLKIFGGFSRALPKKSFAIKFRSSYGKSHIDYDLYDDGGNDKVKTFVLRSGSQDYTGVMVRDEFFTSLFKENSPHMYIQRYRPVVVYVNAEYYGIYYIREKFNSEYVANHIGGSKDKAIGMMAQHAMLFGSGNEYRELVDYACTHDMKDDAVYKYMESKVDFESLIDFKLGEFYAGNSDAGNIRYFKSTDPETDQKWHWFFYDLDATFVQVKPISFYMQGTSLIADVHSVGPYNVLICQLLKNPKFRQLLLEHWANHLQKTIEPNHAVAVFDKMIKTIEPEMHRECERWPSMSYASWQNHVKFFRETIRNRPSVLQPEFIVGLGVTKEEQKKYFSKIKFTPVNTNK